MPNSTAQSSKASFKKNTMDSYIYFAIIKSVRALFANQPDLASFTSQTNHHEPNLSFHLANELWRYFSWLNCDFDVIKENYGRKRPDVIFHRRGLNRFNLLVVEVKRKTNTAVDDYWICQSDERKINNFWFVGRLHYPFGVSIVIDEQTSEFALALFQNGSQNVRRFSSLNIENGFPEDDGISKICEEIIKAKHQDIDADTSELERQINESVYQLYDSVYQLYDSSNNEEIRVAVREE